MIKSSIDILAVIFLLFINSPSNHDILYFTLLNIKTIFFIYLIIFHIKNIL